jgi:glyoxylase-like metal-dependent hydrolase (beta-lactamase superfamily II)
MSMHRFPELALAAGLTLAASGLAAQTLKAPQPLSIEPVRDKLWLISGEGGNVAALVTDESVVLVDDMFERNHADILAKVAEVTDRPVRYVLNTHQHDDHAGGDRLMLPIAEVIAHENVRANLRDIRQPYYEDTPGLPIGLPELTFSESFTIHAGGETVSARYFGRGHTNGDAVIHFPALGTIHTGDLFIARGSLNIYADYAQGGSLLEWADTIDGILTLDFETIIPGHGPLATRAELIEFRAKLAVMVERMTALVTMGATKAQVAAVFETDYGWRATGCPPSPPTGGCLQYQQLDALIDELAR